MPSDPDTIAAYLEGGSLRDVSERLGIGRAAVSAALRRHSVELRPRAGASDAEIVAMYRQGMTQKAIAEQVGCGRGTVPKILARSGVSTRPPLPQDATLASQFPSLIEEWDTASNTPLDPARLSVSSSELVWWICRGHGHRWQSPIKVRTQRNASGGKCPACRSLAFNSPAIAAELHPAKNGDLDVWHLPNQSNRKVHWICAKGHEWQTTVNSRTGKQRTGCSECRISGRSKREIRLAFELAAFLPCDIGSRYVHGERRPVDIILPSCKVIVEYDGYYYHRNRRAADAAKTADLTNLGWLVIRVREGLRRINEHDVTCKRDTPVELVAAKVLHQIAALTGPIELGEYPSSGAAASETADRYIRDLEGGELPWSPHSTRCINPQCEDPEAEHQGGGLCRPCYMLNRKMRQVHGEDHDETIADYRARIKRDVMKNVEPLFAFHQRHGRWPAKASRSRDEDLLGTILGNIRFAGRHGKLTREQMGVLEAHPAWSWHGTKEGNAPGARFTNAQVKDMRIRFLRGETQTSIAGTYDTAQATVSSIVLGKTYSQPDAIPSEAEETAARAAAPKRGTWSKTADSCADCGTTDRPHYAKDRCERCYSYATYKPTSTRRRPGRSPSQDQ